MSVILHSRRWQALRRNSLPAGQARSNLGSNLFRVDVLGRRSYRI